MRVFYRGQRAVITQYVFETVYTGRAQYAIKDLSELCVVRHGPERGPGMRIMGLSALVAAVLVVPLVGPFSNVAAGVAACTFVVGGVTNLCRRSPLRLTLVATYKGRSVILFESERQTEFDQVCRGLRRALEYRENR
jgi:hypothetical protein